MSQPTYLDEKSEGDHSMSVKRGTGEALTPRDAPQGSHAMVKADSLRPSSQGSYPPPSVRALEDDATPCHTPTSKGPWHLPLGGHDPNEDWQGNERATYSVLSTPAQPVAEVRVSS
jgi:hypothetical protein